MPEYGACFLGLHDSSEIFTIFSSLEVSFNLLGFFFGTTAKARHYMNISTMLQPNGNGNLI